MARAAGGKERANYQMFLDELCLVLDLPQPDPEDAPASGRAYGFEYPPHGVTRRS